MSGGDAEGVQQLTWQSNGLSLLQALQGDTALNENSLLRNQRLLKDDQTGGQEGVVPSPLPMNLDSENRHNHFMGLATEHSPTQSCSATPKSTYIIKRYKLHKILRNIYTPWCDICPLHR